ncbi:uncharacterized protein LOC110986920 isoform X2 [Acanthaster planci]|nr:uncharacterized protein LOC110986920 isoform X2 [Acanthaster planci]
MAHIYERVVQLISQDPTTRLERDIESLIPWFQNMSGLFKSQKTDVVKDIVRNCEFRSVPTDNIIIKQGDKGDCFYIILSGSVSIYINQTLEEQGNIQNPNDLAKAKRKAKTRGNRSRSNSIKPKPGLRGRSKSLHKPSIALRSSSPQTRSKGPEKQDSETGEGPSSPGELKNGSNAGASDGGLRPPGGNKAQRNGSTRESRSHTWVSTSTYSAKEASFFQKKEHEEDQLESSSSSDEEMMKTDSSGKLDRTIFGVHIRELGPGKSFGELALVQTNLIRSASVIADQPTGLIVVDRDLYNRSLKAVQQQEFAGKKKFVNTFPLFSHWTPRQRNVMAMSLTRVRYQFGNSIVRQGDKVRGLIFITSGRAVFSIDPVQHIEQYPNMCSQEDIRYAKEVRLGKRSRTSFPGSCDYWLSDLRRPGPNNPRRRDGYAAAEKEANKKSVPLCAIGQYDYIGDISVLLHLPTYVATATCLEPLEALELDLNNFERQVFKKSHSTYVTMREIAELRLWARVDRLHEEQVYDPVFETMLGKLQELNTSPAMKAALRRKQAEEEDLMVSLFTPSWHIYREKQRLFLRRRRREKRLQEMRMQQMAHAASLGMQLKLQGMSTLSELKTDESNPPSHRSHEDALPASLRDNAIPSYSLQPKAVTPQGRQRSMSDRYDHYYLPSYSGGAPTRAPLITTDSLPLMNGLKESNDANGKGDGEGENGDSGRGSHVIWRDDVKRPRFKSWNGPVRQDSDENHTLPKLTEEKSPNGQQRLRPQQANSLLPLGIGTTQ